MNKQIASADAAVALIPDGATIMMGGFGLCGIPESLIAALHRRGTRDLTVISNNAGVDDFGIGVLLRARQVRKMIATYVGENKEFERQFLIEGTRGRTDSRRARSRNGSAPAAPASAASSRPTGYGTIVAEGKETREIDGVHYVLEAPLRADFAFVKAHTGDTHGNLRLPAHRPQLQPGDGHRRASDDRRGRASRAARATSTPTPS